MPNADRFIRLQIMLHPDELQALETWRFNKHMPSRASAIRELLRRGLATDGFTLAPLGKFSSAFSVLETPDEET